MQMLTTSWVTMSCVVHLPQGDSLHGLTHSASVSREYHLPLTPHRLALYACSRRILAASVLFRADAMVSTTKTNQKAVTTPAR